MNENYEKLMKCFECVQQKITFKPEIALILGSCLLYTSPSPRD